MHPRPDLRHVRAGRRRALAGAAARPRRVQHRRQSVRAARAARYPGLIALVREVRPAQVTLVPDGDGQITSDHGFDLRARLRAAARRWCAHCKRGRLPREPVRRRRAQRHRAASPMSARIASRSTPGPMRKRFARWRCIARRSTPARDTARRAHAGGLGVNAGHDLSQAQPGRASRRAIPLLAEVSIGHALIGEALYDGLADDRARLSADPPLS